jgi:hypothetical protein
MLVRLAEGVDRERCRESMTRVKRRKQRKALRILAAQKLHHVPSDIRVASKTDIARAIATTIAKRKRAGGAHNPPFA